jgi:hypothetical protein
MKTLKLARDKKNYYSIYSLRLLFMNCVDFRKIFFCIKYIHVKPLLICKTVSKTYESIDNMERNFYSQISIESIISSNIKQV